MNEHAVRPNLDHSPEAIDAAFRAFVGDAAFPCLAGKGVLHRRAYRLGVYGALGDDRPTERARFAGALASFVGGLPEDASRFAAFVAVFPDRAPTSEHEFERRLWIELERLHAADATGLEWDRSVSADPESPRFSFSFAGRAMFVVGMHPCSSRLARRFAWPALVFNPRAQFARLRETGHYERLRSAVREREIALQGTLNPNLADFGQASEARQYSGRATESDWRCPFHPRDP